MENYITANVANNLYWFGRHIQRVEVMLHEILFTYDKIIDIDKEAGVKLYEKVGVELSYKNAMDFFQQAVFGKHGANLNALMEYARENAIISRNYINADAFGEIIELRAMFKAASECKDCIDYKFIDTALSLISEIWGQLQKKKFKRNSDYFMKLGKLVEEADFHFRFGKHKHLAMAKVEDINIIIDILNEKSQTQTSCQYSQDEEIMNSIHERISAMMVF
jgi:uncharacterized alpha-E superfamily protein